MRGREKHAARLGDVEPGDEVRNRLLAPRPNGLKLFLGPVEQPAYLRESAQQVAPRFRLPEPVALGLSP
eukprot:908602-Alexandrium_andersonii.AAC.1